MSFDVKSRDLQSFFYCLFVLGQNVTARILNSTECAVHQAKEVSCEVNFEKRKTKV